MKTKFAPAAAGLIAAGWLLAGCVGQVRTTDGTLNATNRQVTTVIVQSSRQQKPDWTAQTWSVTNIGGSFSIFFTIMGSGALKDIAGRDADRKLVQTATGVYCAVLKAQMEAVKTVMPGDSNAIELYFCLTAGAIVTNDAGAGSSCRDEFWQQLREGPETWFEYYKRMSADYRTFRQYVDGQIRDLAGKDKTRKEKAAKIIEALDATKEALLTRKNR